MAVFRFFKKVWGSIVFQERDPVPTNEKPDLRTTINEAKLEWQHARMYLDSVTDPDLVDHAIYSMEAAEKKYTYLIKQAKKSGLKVE